MNPETEPVEDRESVRVEPRLAEILREAERILDHQARAIEELDDKSEQLITLSVAALAGGAALGVLGVRETPGGLDLFAVLLLAAAGTTNLVGLFMIVNSYVGLLTEAEVHVGPDMEWLVQKANEPRWNLRSHFVNVITAFAGYYRNNVAKMRHSVRWRRRGVYALVAGVGAYATTFLLILSRSIP